MRTVFRIYELKSAFDLGIEIDRCQGKSYSICFSGVRDKSLESELEGRGHKIVSGVSKNTDILIVKDVNGNSSKINKAKELGVDILSIDDREGILSKING